MKVILLCDVKDTGKKDDIVNVSDGFARNFLFPKKWAMEAKPGAMKEVERRRANEEKLERERREAAVRKSDELRGKVVSMKVKCGEKGRLYGSITAQEIADAIKAQHDIDIDKRSVECETIRQTGDVNINVRVYAGITTPMIVRVEPMTK